jgi:hypothetical protein
MLEVGVCPHGVFWVCDGGGCPPLRRFASHKSVPTKKIHKYINTINCYDRQAISVQKITKSAHTTSIHYKVTFLCSGVMQMIYKQQELFNPVKGRTVT